eukprot:tig00001416_g8950.t1
MQLQRRSCGIASLPQQFRSSAGPTNWRASLARSPAAPAWLLSRPVTRVGRRPLSSSSGEQLPAADPHAPPLAEHLAGPAAGSGEAAGGAEAAPSPAEISSEPSLSTGADVQQQQQPGRQPRQSRRRGRKKAAEQGAGESAGPPGPVQLEKMARIDKAAEAFGFKPPSKRRGKKRAAGAAGDGATTKKGGRSKATAEEQAAAATAGDAVAQQAAAVEQAGAPAPGLALEAGVPAGADAAGGAAEAEKKERKKSKKQRKREEQRAQAKKEEEQRVARRHLVNIMARHPFGMTKDGVDSFLRKFDAFPGRFPYVQWAALRTAEDDRLKEELIAKRAELLLKLMPPGRFRDFVARFPVKFVDCEREVGQRVKFLTQECKFIRRDIFMMLSQPKGVDYLLKLRRETWERSVLAPLRDFGFNADETRRLVVGRPELLAVGEPHYITGLVETATRVMPSLRTILASADITDRVFRFTFFRKLFDFDFPNNLSGIIQQLMRAGFDQAGAEAFIREFPEILYSKALQDLKPKIDYLEENLGINVRKLGPIMIANHRKAEDSRYPNIDYLLFVPRRAW